MRFACTDGRRLERAGSSQSDIAQTRSKVNLQMGISRATRYVKKRVSSDCIRRLRARKVRLAHIPFLHSSPNKQRSQILRERHVKARISPADLDVHYRRASTPRDRESRRTSYTRTHLPVLERTGRSVEIHIEREREREREREGEIEREIE
jgi:hypothetical protein